MAVVAFYQTVGGKNESGQGKIANKYGQQYPVGLLHSYVRGLVSDDFSYIVNSFGRTVLGPPAAHVHFRVDPLPVSITGITLKARAQTTEGSGGPTADNRLFAITLWQGDPSSGDEVQIHKWKIPDRDDSARPANDTFFDISEVIAAGNIANITDAADLWLDVGMEYAVGFTIERLYWLALEVTSPYALVGAPTTKNYANSLTPIAFTSAVQKGTAGTAKWRYRIVPCDSDGVCSPASDEFGVDDGNDDLDATDHVCLSWRDVTGAANYKVYRTKSGGTPSSLGLIATVLPDLGDCGGGGGG
ncbi:hypothetical protein LCGC14_2281440, partial [marine sediment metagenome]